MTESDILHPLVQELRRGLARRDLFRSLVAAALGGTTAASLLLRAADALAEAPKVGGRLRVASQSDSTAGSLDPSRGTNTTDYSRAFMFYNGLTRLDADLVPQPELAESFTSDDAVHWNVKLRKAIVFADGSKLTPADVIFTIKRIQDPATGSSARALLAEVSEVTADGPDALKIILKGPNADLPITFGTPHLMIVKEGTSDFSKGNGTGPYRVKEFTPGTRSIATRKTDYWKNGKPYIEQIEYFSIQDETARVNAMLAGDIEVAAQIGARVTRRIKATPGFTVMETKSGNYNDFILRQDSELTNNPDLALAIKYIQDREGMQRALGGGVIGNDQPIYPSNRYFNASLPQRPYDPDKAKFHFGKSGLGNTALPLYAMSNNTMLDQAVIIQQSALGIGMNIDVKRMPGDGYWTNVWCKYPFTGGNINPRPSADSLLTLFFASKAPWNETAWKNEQFDKLLVEARAATDEAKRKQMYGEMQTLIADKDSLCIPLFNSFYDGHTTTLKGLSPVPTGGMMGFGFAENVWLDA